MKVRTENRGANMVAASAENRENVVWYFQNNPSSTLKEAAEALGLSVKTVSNHIKAHEAGK